MIYGRWDWAVLWFTAGLLAGLVVGFASCAPDTGIADTHITTGGRP